MSENLQNRQKFVKSDKKLGHFGAHRPKLVHGMTKLPHGVTKNFFANFPLTLLKSLDHGFFMGKKHYKFVKMIENFRTFYLSDTKSFGRLNFRTRPGN